MIFYVENLKELKNSPTINKWALQGWGYKVSIQKSADFLYTAMNNCNLKCIQSYNISIALNETCISLIKYE